MEDKTSRSLPRAQEGRGHQWVLGQSPGLETNPSPHLCERGLSSPSGWCLTDPPDSSPVPVTPFKSGIVKRERENALGRTTPHTHRVGPGERGGAQNTNNSCLCGDAVSLGQWSKQPSWIRDWLSVPHLLRVLCHFAPQKSSTPPTWHRVRNLCPPQLTAISQVERPLLQADPPLLQ